MGTKCPFTPQLYILSHMPRQMENLEMSEREKKVFQTGLFESLTEEMRTRNNPGKTFIEAIDRPRNCR